MNNYQKKLVKVSKLFDMYYTMFWVKDNEKSFGWHRCQMKISLKEDKINNIEGITKEIKLYKDEIEEETMEIYCQSIGVNHLTECEKELAMEITYSKYSKPYKTKKQYKRLKKK